METEPYCTLSDNALVGLIVGEDGTTATGCRGVEGDVGKPEPTTEPKRNKVRVATPALHLAMEAGGTVERGDHFPWHCPSCGEWETTHRVEPTWWESVFKNWEYGAMACPRCSHRYPL